MKNETTMKYITCEETELLVDDYLEGMISNENRQLMEAHLKGTLRPHVHKQPSIAEPFAANWEELIRLVVADTGVSSGVDKP